jgi:hypothetical protein
MAKDFLGVQSGVNGVKVDYGCQGGQERSKECRVDQLKQLGLRCVRFGEI